MEFCTIPHFAGSSLKLPCGPLSLASGPLRANTTFLLWKKIGCNASFGFTSSQKKKQNTIPRHSGSLVLHQSEGIVKSSAWKEKLSGGFEATALQNLTAAMASAARLHASAMRLHQWNVVVCVCVRSPSRLPFPPLAVICRHEYNAVCFYQNTHYT